MGLGWVLPIDMLNQEMIIDIYIYISNRTSLTGPSSTEFVHQSSVGSAGKKSFFERGEDGLKHLFFC